MKRRRPPRLARCCAVTLVMVSIFGCASLTDNEVIVRVEASRDPLKATRLTLQGVKSMHTGDVDRAVHKYMEALVADESYGPAHSNLGLLHYEQGNLYQSVLAFERAMELMPYDPIVYYNLGLALETAGKVHDAMDLYWRAVEMDPVNPVFLGNLVRLRVRLGEEGPDVVTQLEDLALIETRPDWRRWADRQLALFYNDALDRGPETPDFNSGLDDRDSADRDAPQRIIDLTPGNESEEEDREDPEAGDMSISQPRIVPSPEFRVPSVRSKPLPVMQDSGSFEELPPSIEILPGDSDYFQ